MSPSPHGPEGDNDFSNDPNCVALYNFENGALTTDSKGGNTLSVGGNSPTAVMVDYKQGLASCDFEASNNQYWTIADADLDAGFPLKNGDAVGNISVCCWIKLTGKNEYQTFYEKGDTDKWSFTLGVSNSNLVWVLLGKDN